MKICALSDLHGCLPEIEKEFDLMIICGDVCPVTDHRYSFQSEWVTNEFAEWINSLPFADDDSIVCMTWGNHDFFEGLDTLIRPEIYRNTGSRLRILTHEETEFKGIRIFGTPYCKEFGHWSFMHPDDYLKKKFDSIPEGVDILFSHDPADMDDMGMILQNVTWGGKNAGNVLMADVVKRVKPKYYFAGHIHSGNHDFHMIDGTMCANVSIMDELYSEAYEPLYFEYGEHFKDN